VTKLWITVLVCFFGVILGDSIVFFVGAHYGRKVTKYWPFSRLLTEEKLLAAKEKFAHKKGLRLLFAARFMPGLRAPVYFSAGVLHVPYLKMLAYDGLAALLSVPAIVLSVYYFGDTIDTAIKAIKKAEHGILFVIIGVIVLGLLKYLWKRYKKK
jgi:membrane protein DedA with SNARE-associated domain